MAMNRRAEILFTEDEYEEVKKAAKERGLSVGELVRDAIRRIYLQPSKERRDAAFDWLMSQEVDIGIWEEVKPLIGRYVDKEPDDNP